MENNAVEQLLADSRLAFLNQQNGKALNLALEAIKLEPKNADAYKCAGNAYMSMERYDDALIKERRHVESIFQNGVAVWERRNGTAAAVPRCGFRDWRRGRLYRGGTGAFRRRKGIAQNQPPYPK